jgi:hypothetical protein
MTSYEILKPFTSKALGTHDSGIINVNPSTTGNKVVDDLVDETTATEVASLVADGSLKATA